MFRFKMQSVLDYRSNIEEKVLGEYSDLKRRHADEKEILKQLVGRRREAVTELRATENKVMSALEIAERISYIESIRVQEEQQKTVIREVKALVEHKRRELMEAVKNKKVMEKLKERHAEEYRKEMSELEQKNSDEMSVLKFGRRQT